ncbi:MAG TPA: HAMP domain-containing protein, partial [Anaerolineales bacterium]
MASLKANLPEPVTSPKRSQGSRLNTFIHSIRFRLTIWFAAILIIVLAVLSGFVFLQQASFLNYTTLNRLELKDRQLVAFFRFAGLSVSANGQLSIPQTDRSGQPLLQEDEILTIIDPQGQVLLKQGTISDSDAARLSQQSLQRPAAVEAFRFRLNDNETAGNAPRDYIFIATPLVSNEGNLGYMLLGRPVDPTGQLHRLLFTLLAANLGTLFLALAGGYLLADRAMRPVHTITSTARQIGETDLNRRLNLKTQDELGELANTFDQMLDRLQAAFQRQRQFTADASHELRT